MQIYELQFEQLDFLLRAFAYATEPDFLQKLKDSTSVFKEIEEFLPRLADQASKEIERSNISDIVTLMISFNKLWDKCVFTKPQALKVVYTKCDMYLSEYLGKSKKEITGSQFASLVEQIANAHLTGIHKFELKIVHNLQHIFLNDNADLYVFSMGDILKLFKGFESINEYVNRGKVIAALVDLVLVSRIFEDEAFLEVLNECQHRGLIESYPDLAIKARAYF